MKRGVVILVIILISAMLLISGCRKIDSGEFKPDEIKPGEFGQRPGGPQEGTPEGKEQPIQEGQQPGGEFSFQDIVLCWVFLRKL